MSYNADFSSSNISLVHSNTGVYESAPLTEEEKIALEKEVIDELPADQPTDIKVNYNSKKTFLRRRENSNNLIPETNSPDLRNEKIEFSEYCAIEKKDIKSEKKRRHYSLGSSAIPKIEKDHSRERKSMNLRSSTINSSATNLSSSTTNLSSSTASLKSNVNNPSSCNLGNNTNSQSNSVKFDLNFDVLNINSNESNNKSYSMKNVNSEPSLKSPRSSSALPSLKLSISSLNSFGSSRKTPRKMRVSISEKNVMQNSGDALNSARNYLNSLRWILEYIQETDAPVYNHSKKGFGLKKICDVKQVDRENSIRKILEKIKKIAASSLREKGLTENVELFEDVIAHVEQANWSRELFNSNLDNQLKTNLDLTKKAVEDVKMKNTLFKLSTDLVAKIFPENLEKDPSEKMTLSDLSLVFPKISSFSELFSKISALLNQNESKIANQCLLEFCVKCLEKGIGLGNNPEVEIYSAVKEICDLALVPDEMKSQLVSAYKVALNKAAEMKEAKDWLLKKQEPCLNEISDNSKLDLFQSTGFYQLFRSEQRKDGKEQIVALIAKSIVKKTAAELIAIPLDEFLSESMEEQEKCPCYMQVGINLEKLSRIVASEILSYMDIADRRKVISFYISVIRECIALGDYASAFALKTGLDKTPIARLKDTMDSSMWEKDVKKQFKILERLFTYENKFKNLFSVMGNCKCDYFMLPPGIFGSKVIYAENKIDSVKDNLGKECIVQTMLRYLAQEVILPLQKMQQCLSNISKDKILVTDEMFDQKLEVLKASLIDEDALYKLSLKLEPSKMQ